MRVMFEFENIVLNLYIILLFNIFYLTVIFDIYVKKDLKIMLINLMNILIYYKLLNKYHKILTN